MATLGIRRGGGHPLPACVHLVGDTSGNAMPSAIERLRHRGGSLQQAPADLERWRRATRRQRHLDGRFDRPVFGGGAAGFGFGTPVLVHSVLAAKGFTAEHVVVELPVEPAVLDVAPTEPEVEAFHQTNRRRVPRVDPDHESLDGQGLHGVGHAEPNCTAGVPTPAGPPVERVRQVRQALTKMVGLHGAAQLVGRRVGDGEGPPGAASEKAREAPFDVGLHITSRRWPGKVEPSADVVVLPRQVRCHLVEPFRSDDHHTIRAAGEPVGCHAENGR